MLLLDAARTQVEHHHHEDEDDHDGGCINDDLERGNEGSAELIKDDRDREQRDDQVEKRVNRVGAGHHHQGRHERDRSGDVERRAHGRRLRTSTGGRSFSASPLSLPSMASPATR